MQAILNFAAPIDGAELLQPQMGRGWGWGEWEDTTEKLGLVNLSDQQQQESDWCLQERSGFCLPGVATTIHTLKPGSSSTTKLDPGTGKKGKRTCFFHCLSSNRHRLLCILLVPRMNPSNSNVNYFSEYPEINNWSRGLLITAVKCSWGKWEERQSALLKPEKLNVKV